MSRIEQLIAELCPEGVEFIKLGNISKYIRGITYSKNDEIQFDEGLKVLRANNITVTSNRLNFDDIRYVSTSVKIRDDQKLKKSDILICAASGSKDHIGKVAFISNDTDYTFGGFMAVIRTEKNLCSRFLFHLLIGSTFKRYLETALNSTTINNLNYQVISEFLIPIPSLSIQQEIVRILDTFTDLDAELQAELEARKKQYEHYRNQLLNFEGKEVEWKTIVDCFELKNGYTPSKLKSEYWENGNIPWFRMEDIRKNGRILSDAIQHITPEAVKSKLFPSNSILLATTATIGEHALITVPSLANQQFTYITLRKSFESKINMKYFYYFMFIVDEWCKNNTNVSGFSSVDMAKFRKLLIPIPSLPEQERIVSILDKFEVLVNAELPAEIAARRKQYEYYREKLLTFKPLVS